MIIISVYTTTLWEIVKDKNGGITKSVDEMIEVARPYIFNFDYDTPKNVEKSVFKKWFETTFISKFMLWEIGFDTFEQFQLQLFSKCNRIMPMYCIILDRIYFAQNLSNDDFYNIKKGTSQISYSDKIISSDKSNDITNEKGSNIHSTLPINMIKSNAIEDVDYADDSSKQNKDTNRKLTTDTNSSKIFNENKTYDIKSGSIIDTMSKFTETFNNEMLKSTNKLFDEFNYLFIGVL